MRYLVFLMPFMLAACATSNAELAQNAFVHDDAVCTARGYDANSDYYVKCMRHLGARVGYQLGKSDGGALAFLISPAGEFHRVRFGSRRHPRRPTLGVAVSQNSKSRRAVPVSLPAPR